MKSIKKIAALCLILFFSALSFAETETISVENSRLNINVFTLKNGLTFFAIQDKTNALVKADFVCRAGFSSQTSSTCGFYKLYSRILTESAKKEFPEFFNHIDFQSECKSESTVYTSTMPAEEVASYLKNMSQIFSDTAFDDGLIEKNIKEMKKEISDYAAGTAGFINSSIDAVIFKSEPWKHDSGIYPAIFSDYSISQTRTILTSIKETYYTPENCALFITGNVNPEELEEIAEKEFSIWKVNRKNSILNFIPEKESTETENKKYVLVSDAFSKDLTQIVVQFTAMDFTRCQILATAMNMDDSTYKNTLISDKDFFIRGPEYISAASAGAKGCNRLIIQSLLEENGNKTSIAGQAESFVKISKEAAKLSHEEFTKSQNKLIKDFNLNRNSSLFLTEQLASFWQNGQWTVPEEFYNSFIASFYRIQNETEEETANQIEQEVPFVFLLINTKKYTEQKKHFDEAGYVKIDETNSSWWKNEVLAKKAEAEKKQLLIEEKKGDTKIIKAKPAEIFYASAIKSIKEKKLSNGIPVLVKENKNSETVCVSIAIQGGMMASPVNEKNLRTILTAALAKNSNIENAKAETKETVSYLTYEVEKEDFEDSLKKITDALVYGDIKPVQADRLFAEENYRIFMEDSDLGSQLKRNVFAYLYRDTKIGQMYRDYENKNNTVSYQSLLTGYTEFLDASLYSIVICGNIDSETAFDPAEKAFGILKEQKNRNENQVDFPKPAWKNKERKVQLRHLYSSDLPPELAPKESPFLVPTKEFLDPVQLYFAAPEDKTELEKFNALLMEISSRIDKETYSYCKYYSATKLIPVGYIHGNKIKKSEAFVKLYKKHRNALLEELADKEQRVDTLRTIKSRYEMNMLEKTSTNEGTAELLQQGIADGNATDFLISYLEIENSKAKSFYEILIKYIPETPLMKVRSVDSK